eukprot:3250912-Prymnesium_polylepis.2
MFDAAVRACDPYGSVGAFKGAAQFKYPAVHLMHTVPNDRCKKCSVIVNLTSAWTPHLTWTLSCFVTSRTPVTGNKQPAPFLSCTSDRTHTL